LERNSFSTWNPIGVRKHDTQRQSGLFGLDGENVRKERKKERKKRKKKKKKIEGSE